MYVWQLMDCIDMCKLQECDNQASAQETDGISHEENKTDSDDEY